MSLVKELTFLDDVFSQAAKMAQHALTSTQETPTGGIFGGICHVAKKQTHTIQFITKAI